MRTEDGTKILIAEDGKLLVLDQNVEQIEIKKDDPLL